jgi:hypothetical protein
MLKNELVNIYLKVMEENNFTYSDMQKLTKLSSSQLASVLKHNADKVSIEKMEDGLYNIGFGLELVPFHLEEKE